MAGGGRVTKNMTGVREKNQMYGGGASAKKKMCGGASEIFSSLSPPEDFKWNSPNHLKFCIVFH